MCPSCEYPRENKGKLGGECRKSCVGRRAKQNNAEAREEKRGGTGSYGMPVGRGWAIQDFVTACRIVSYRARIVSPLRGTRGESHVESVIRCYKHNSALARRQPRGFTLNGSPPNAPRKKISPSEPAPINLSLPDRTHKSRFTTTVFLCSRSHFRSARRGRHFVHPGLSVAKI